MALKYSLLHPQKQSNCKEGEATEAIGYSALRRGLRSASPPRLPTRAMETQEIAAAARHFAAMARIVGPVSPRLCTTTTSSSISNQLLRITSLTVVLIPLSGASASRTRRP